VSTTPRLDNLAAHGTNRVFAHVRLADGHALSVKAEPGADAAEQVYLHDDLTAPDTEAWVDDEGWRAPQSADARRAMFVNVPVQAVRELVEQHGGEHADQDRATYRVTVLRAERIEFTVEADSPEDAEARYLMDGIEGDSELDSTTVESVTLDRQ
jgi:hypothetical protein